MVPPPPPPHMVPPPPSSPPQVITGIGKHSMNGLAMIKPSVLSHLEALGPGYEAEVDPDNSGQVIVHVLHVVGGS